LPVPNGPSESPARLCCRLSLSRSPLRGALRISIRHSATAAMFVSALFWLCPASALGQSRATSADLTGTVKDDSQAVVPGARVTARNLETNVERDAFTRPDGRFVMAAVPLGVYRVRIDLTGFATVVIERVELTLGSSVDIDVVKLGICLILRLVRKRTARHTAAGATCSLRDRLTRRTQSRVTTRRPADVPAALPRSLQFGTDLYPGAQCEMNRTAVRDRQ
jgi:hypothetical protein